MARAPDTFVLEGLVTTLSARGEVNVSPMGPIVNGDMERLLLRPFHTSTTFANLKRSSQGVFHVTDDVELLARAAIGRLKNPPDCFAAAAVEGAVLADACRWYAFRVEKFDQREPRAELDCKIVDSGRIRDFVGFNRAKHAVLEGAILATRVEFLPASQINDEFQRLATLVEKTGGPQERRAFALLQQYVCEGLEKKPTTVETAKT